VASLIELGAQINGHFEEDGKQEIPLLLSVRYGHKTIASLLLANGANVLQCDQDGNNALHIAASLGREDFIDIFSDTGLQGFNNSGLTPFDIAFQSGFFRMAETLKTFHDIDDESNSDANITPYKEDLAVNDIVLSKHAYEVGRDGGEFSLEDTLDLDGYENERQGETNRSISKDDLMDDIQNENRRLTLSLKEMQILANNSMKAAEILENKCYRFQAEIVSLQHEINQLNGNDITNKNLQELKVLELKLKAALDKVATQKNALTAKEIMDEGRLCVICHDEQKSVLFLPCRHLCICRQCSDIEQLEKCPLCRQTLEEKLHVYS
jgi:hypothetical protein